MYQQHRLVSLIRQLALSKGEVTLASGQKSQYYVDMSKVSLTAAGIKQIAQGIGELVDWSGVDSVGGPVLGAIPIVDSLILTERVQRGFYVRKEAKEHGDRQLIEGCFVPGDRVVMVEDVVTTGGSLLKALNAVVNAGGNVVALITVLDRQEGAADMFESLGYKLISLLSSADLQEQ